METKWFIVALIILWILWVITNGPSRIENRDKPFLEQPAPIESGRPYTLEQLREGTRP